MLEVTGGGGPGVGKNGKVDDFDMMMAAEEFGERSSRRVGADQADMGY